MREAGRDKERLLHIKEAIGRIKRYMDGVTVESLKHDDMRYYAVVKNLEIIGEAANMLTKEFRTEHPATQWKMEIYPVRFGEIRGVREFFSPPCNKPGLKTFYCCHNLKFRHHEEKHCIWYDYVRRRADGWLRQGA